MNTESERPVIEGEVVKPEPEQALVTEASLREQAIIARGRDMDATQFTGRGNEVFASGISFQLACKMADWMAQASILPEAYSGKPANCLVAIDYAARLGVSPIQLAQNMDMVKGRPGLRGTFLAGLINACPLFSRLKYRWQGTDNPNGDPSDDFGCRAYATELETGEELLGTLIDWRMVKKEGWHKNDKWYSMREQMFTYRAAAFWSRAHASDITLGLHDIDELRDADPDHRGGRSTPRQPAPKLLLGGGLDAIGQALAAQRQTQEGSP